MVIKGFRFGMLLQLAVGPVCLYIFQSATLQGFYSAEAGVIGVALVDTLFILAAILGIAAVIGKKKVQQVLKVFGAVVLFFFGISTILSPFNINLLPSLSMADNGVDNIFLQAIIITASNLLTILFWAGVFSSKITEQHMEKKDVWLFGFGAAISTLAFLTVIALAGSLTNTFLPKTVIMVLNELVGLALVVFGVKMLLPSAKVKGEAAHIGKE